MGDFSLVLMFALAWCFCRSILSENLPTSDIDALYDLYSQANGIYWNWRPNDINYFGITWNFTDPDPCGDGWQGVECTTYNGVERVSVLNLTNFNVSGQLSSTIGNLTNLTRLALHSNYITGIIPSTITLLTSLSELDLGSNELHSTIPEGLFSLPNLKFLQIGYNNLTGSLMGMVFSESLVEIDLSFNRLTGNLPRELFSLPKLRILQLVQNNFNGSLPDPLEATQLYELRDLDLSGNNFTGKLPGSIAVQNPYLRTIDISYNGFTGTIPSEIGALREALDLDFFENRFRGAVPSSLANMTRLKLANFASNSLSGSFPTVFCAMPWLRNLDIANNSFYGPLPACIGNMTGLRTLELPGNSFSGSLPAALFTLYNLSMLDLGVNAFSQSFPAAIVQLVNLETLDIGTNHFHGTIPSSIDQLVNLKRLYLSDNRFEGNLPDTVGNMKELRSLSAAYCRIGGTVPLSIANATNLLLLDISSNSFSGTLPVELTSLRDLLYLDLDSNDFTGTIPAEYGEFPQLVSLFLFTNRLDGTIPCSLANLTLLSSLFLDENLLSGTVCDELFLRMPGLDKVYLNLNSLTGTLPPIASSGMEEIFMGENMFTGTIPDSYCTSVTMSILDLADSLLTGTIPNAVADRVHLGLIALNSNLLTGTIPSALGQIDHRIMFGILLFSNSLTGPLPAYLSNLKFLSAVLLHDNKLTGEIASAFSKDQGLLQNIDISTNYFVGALPDAVFQVSGLLSFASVSNCLGGELPDTICEAKGLQVLALDGIGTARKCRQRLFPQFLGISSYSLEHAISGSIPQCLLQLPNLQRLFLAGNGLQGTLPSGPISSSLVNVDVSHNALTGTLPYSFQQHIWSGGVDVSSNRLGGLLHDSFAHNPANASIQLELNLFSGEVPSSLQETTSVNVLTGNLFQCGLLSRDGLPSKDPSYNTYQCGTNTFYIALAVFAFVILVAVVRAYTLFQRKELHFTEAQRKVTLVLELAKKWLSVFQASQGGEELHVFGQFMAQIRRMCWLLCLLVVCVMVPVYIAVGSRYGQYTYAYAMAVSAAYNAGVVSAAVLFATFSLFLLGFAVSCRVLVKSTLHAVLRKLSIITSGSERGQNILEVITAGAAKWKSRYYGLMAAGTFLNIVVVMGVNIAFVYITVTCSPIAVLGAQLAIAVFKLAWNELFVRRAFLYSSKYGKQTHRMEVLPPSTMPFLTVVYIFNTIVAPCIAIAIIVQNCFETAIFPPPPLTSSYYVSTCSKWIIKPLLEEKTVAGGTQCVKYADWTFSASFAPPFHYSYHCASSVLQNYATAFVELLLLFILEPMILLALRRVFFALQDSAKHSLMWYLRNAILRHILPVMMKVAPKEANASKTYFKRDRFAMRIVAVVSVLVSFGIVFPPIGLLCLYTIAQYTAYEQLLIGCFITSAEEQHVFFLRHQICNECTGVVEYLKQAFGILMQISGIVCAWFIFDTYGSEEGSVKAVPLAVAMIFAPRIITLLVFFPEAVNSMRGAWLTLRETSLPASSSRRHDKKSERDRSTLAGGNDRNSAIGTKSDTSRDSSILHSFAFPSVYRMSRVSGVSSSAATSRESAMELTVGRGSKKTESVRQNGESLKHKPKREDSITYVYSTPQSISADAVDVENPIYRGRL